MLLISLFIALSASSSSEAFKKTPRDLLNNIDGFFYSGGGYVSHGEACALTHAWNKYFHSGSLSDFFSNVVVGTTSGGGWFFNDLVYSPEFQKIVDADTHEEYIDRITVYYENLISKIYDVSVKEIREKTSNGKWSGMSEMDYTHLYSAYDSWEALVTKFHYMYGDKPVLPIEKTNWESTFGIATDYGHTVTTGGYKLVSEMEIIDNPQRSTWHHAVPSFIDFEFNTKNENPGIEIDIPTFDNKYASVCSIIRTSRSCKEDKDCMKHAWCDTGLKQCLCDHTHTPMTDKSGVEYCQDCRDPELNLFDTSAESGLSAKHEVKVVWGSWRPETKDMRVSDLKEKIRKSVDDPKKYSGPSSAALAIAAADSATTQTMFATMGLQAAWETEKLTELFGDHWNTPSLDLIDGGGMDNCAITAIVHRLQHNARNSAQLVGAMEWTLVGMCSREEIEDLISSPGSQMGKYRLYEIFEYENPEIHAQGMFSGEVMQVWGFRVKTVWEPMNGIMAGSTFNIFAFSFPEDTNRGGICRNWGNSMMSVGDMKQCSYNHGKKGDEVRPLMSLVPGRGETEELVIASEFILNDMEKFGKVLEDWVEGNSGINDLPIFKDEMMTNDVAAQYIPLQYYYGFAFIGLLSLIAMARNAFFQKEFTPIADSANEV